MLNNFKSCPVCGNPEESFFAEPEDRSVAQYNGRKFCTSYYPKRANSNPRKCNFHYIFKPGIFEQVTIGNFIFEFISTGLGIYSYSADTSFKSFHIRSDISFEDLKSQKNLDAYVKELYENFQLMK